MSSQPCLDDRTFHHCRNWMRIRHRNRCTRRTMRPREELARTSATAEALASCVGEAASGDCPTRSRTYEKWTQFRKSIRAHRIGNRMRDGNQGRGRTRRRCRLPRKRRWWGRSRDRDARCDGRRASAATPGPATARSTASSRTWSGRWWGERVRDRASSSTAAGLRRAGWRPGEDPWRDGRRSGDESVCSSNSKKSWRRLKGGKRYGVFFFFFFFFFGGEGVFLSFF